MACSIPDEWWRVFLTLVNIIATLSCRSALLAQFNRWGMWETEKKIVPKWMGGWGEFELDPRSVSALCQALLVQSYLFILVATAQDKFSGILEVGPVWTFPQINEKKIQEILKKVSCLNFLWWSQVQKFCPTVILWDAISQWALAVPSWSCWDFCFFIQMRAAGDGRYSSYSW